MTILHPNPRIARIAFESHAIQLGCKLPLPGVSGAVGESDEARFPAHQTLARRINDAVQGHFTSNPIAGTPQLPRFSNSPRPPKNRMIARRHPRGPSGFGGPALPIWSAAIAVFPTPRVAVSAPA